MSGTSRTPLASETKWMKAAGCKMRKRVFWKGSGRAGKEHNRVTGKRRKRGRKHGHSRGTEEEEEGNEGKRRGGARGSHKMRKAWKRRGRRKEERERGRTIREEEEDR